MAARYTIKVLVEGQEIPLQFDFLDRTLAFDFWSKTRRRSDVVDITQPEPFGTTIYEDLADAIDMLNFWCERSNADGVKLIPDELQ